MLRKLLVCQWFGPLPPWYEHWAANIDDLYRYGYTVLLATDEDVFAERVYDRLGVTYPVGDSRKACDYRATFGLLYADEIAEYDYWGHTDLDMVYGRVGEFLPDDVLGPLELFSNHPTYVSGPWSLYKNTPLVNRLFEYVEDWQGYLENPETTGWVETVFSDQVKDTLAWRFEDWQSYTIDQLNATYFDGDRLMQGNLEVMVAHFRRSKEYPRGCR